MFVSLRTIMDAARDTITTGNAASTEAARAATAAGDASSEVARAAGEAARAASEAARVVEFTSNNATAFFSDAVTGEVYGAGSVSGDSMVVVRFHTTRNMEDGFVVEMCELDNFTLKDLVNRIEA